MLKIHLDKNGNNSTKSITNILKKIFIKDLMLKFTAIKKGVNKDIVFKDSFSYTIVKGKY